MKRRNASVRCLAKQSHRGHRVSTLPSRSTISCFLLSAPLNVNTNVYRVRTNALCPGSPGTHWQNRVPSICEYGLIESEMELEALTSFWCTLRPFLRPLLSPSV